MPKGSLAIVVNSPQRLTDWLLFASTSSNSRWEYKKKLGQRCSELDSLACFCLVRQSGILICMALIICI